MSCLRLICFYACLPPDWDGNVWVTAYVRSMHLTHRAFDASCIECNSTMHSGRWVCAQVESPWQTCCLRQVIVECSDALESVPSRQHPDHERLNHALSGACRQPDWPTMRMLRSLGALFSIETFHYCSSLTLEAVLEHACEHRFKAVIQMHSYFMFWCLLLIN